jgi:protein-tyrosine phosphatase
MAGPITGQLPGQPTAGAGLVLRAPRFLVVCTANVCRSPMAQLLLRRRLADEGVRAAVRSSGRLEGGRPPDPNAVAAMAELCLDIHAHTSTTTTASMVRSADLVIAMAEEHVIDVLNLQPDAADLTFTLTDLARRAELVGRRPPTEYLDDWIGRLRRDTGRLPPLGPDGDVKDPIGSPLAAFRATLRTLDGLLSRVVELAFPWDAPREVPDEWAAPR